MLELAERGDSVSLARAQAFARACVEVSELGRLAMAVMDGGVFASARLIELAMSIVRNAAPATPAAVDAIGIDAGERRRS